MKVVLRPVVLALTSFLSLLPCMSWAQDEAVMTLARQNYILNCQGCHLPDAMGAPGLVPRMKDFVGNFLHVEGGREFIVQVPGSANSPISDEELADVLNWMLDKFSKEQVPQGFQPYTGKEIGSLRARPLMDVNGTRAKLIERIQKKLGITEDALTRVE